MIKNDQVKNKIIYLNQIKKFAYKKNPYPYKESNMKCLKFYLNLNYLYDKSLFYKLNPIIYEIKKYIF